MSKTKQIRFVQKWLNGTGCKHRVLYVPDQVSDEMYQSMIKEPEIHEVLHLIKSANMVLHGIGDAMTMAERRKTAPEIMQKLQQDDKQLEKHLVIILMNRRSCP